MLFANIIVDISHEKLDRPFQYLIPERLNQDIMAGTLVEVPFGKGNRLISGYVIEVVDTPCMEISKIKEISGIKKGSLKIESQLIALAWFMKEHYGSTMNKALKTVIPIKSTVKNKDKKYLRLKVSKEEALDLYQKYLSRKNTVQRAMLIKELTEVDEIELETVKSKLAVSDSIV